MVLSAPSDQVCYYFCNSMLGAFKFIFGYKSVFKFIINNVSNYLTMNIIVSLYLTMYITEGRPRGWANREIARGP